MTGEWAAGYLAGYDAGRASRPTDPEILGWGREIRASAYRKGTELAWRTRIHEHRENAGILTGIHNTVTDRAHSDYIPRLIS